MPYGTVNADTLVTSTSGGILGAGNASIMKNRIINGAMVIDQRNAGTATANTIDGYTLDRWTVFQSTTGKLIAQQNAGSVTPPVGFTNYLGVTSQSAYSVTSTGYYITRQNIEGFNTADLQWGTANAKTVTVSAWVRSSLTGTFGGAVRNASSDYSYPFTYSIPTANTWTQISVTIAGPTAGTWEGATNGLGIQVIFGFGVGSTLSGTAGAWASASYLSATGATSVVGTNGATFYITGVQLEVGSSATGYEYVNYQTSLANCQRYFAVLASGNAQSVYNGFVSASTNLQGIVNFPVQMRTTPTLSVTTGTAYYKAYTQPLTSNVTSLAIDTGLASQYSASLYTNSGASGLTNGQGGLVYTGSASSFVAVQAEL
jgi:hypothetical protein